MEIKKKDLDVKYDERIPYPHSFGTQHVTREENELYLFFFLKISSLAKLNGDAAVLCRQYHHELLRQTMLKKSLTTRKAQQEASKKGPVTLTRQDLRELLADPLGIKYFLQFHLQEGIDTMMLQLFMEIEM